MRTALALKVDLVADETEPPQADIEAAPISSRALQLLARAEEQAAARAEQAVTKANEAITIRPKRGKLTLLSRRIYNAFLYHAQRLGVDNPSYTVPLSELIDDARFNSHNTELLKSHIRDMQATTIEWHTSSGGAQKWTSTQLLGVVNIHEPGRGQACTITWTYPEPIRERLAKPAQYTRVLLEISSQMRSYAAAVLYELGARYLTSPGGLTMREDLLWWASVLTGRSDIDKVEYFLASASNPSRAASSAAGPRRRGPLAVTCPSGRDSGSCGGDTSASSSPRCGGSSRTRRTSR